jgi:phosphate transport system permease protein
MVDAALPSETPRGRHGAGDFLFRGLCLSAATLLVCALAGVVISLFVGGLPAFRQFGFGFLTSDHLEPGDRSIRRGRADRRHASSPPPPRLARGAAAGASAYPIFLVEFCPVKLIAGPIWAIAVELLAGIPSIVYGMWGLFVLAPWFAKHIQLPIDDDAPSPAPAGSTRSSPARPTVPTSSPHRSSSRS